MLGRKSSFDLQGLLACARGELFGEGNARLPLPPMLMFDRITRISERCIPIRVFIWETNALPNLNWTVA